MINAVSNVSFKSYIPVSYYAKHPKNGKFVPVLKKENQRKCHSFIVRNLNGTAKTSVNNDFVKFYSQYDEDYREYPQVQSVYDKNSPKIFMVTGKDADTVKELAKPVGIAKSESIAETGKSQSYKSKNAADRFFNDVKYLINNKFKRVKSPDGHNLSMRVFFEPKYNTKGKLVTFNFKDAMLIKDE
ncbi:hypothetical protein IJ182_05705 [bacterium]|nr:hypothetical protein [bacterium]